MNVVVYVSDALRTDHLGCYGARYVDTRTIDELAAGGVRFDLAITAAPWTAPSTTSIVTGLYPHHHGYLHWDAELDPSIETLFRAFGAHGYEIGSYVFDTSYLFKDLPAANVLGTSESLDGAFAWMRENRERPFLLYFHSWATHMPYETLHAGKDWKAAKQEVIGGIQSDSATALEAMREGYRRAVERQSEELVASFLEELESLALRERTVFAFLSDHGESWGERFESKDDVQGVYHMHGATVNDEIVQVPLIVSAPGALAPGVVVPSQVRTVDLMPTLLGLAGLPARETDGASLLPLVDGREQDDRVAIVAGTDMGALAKLAVRKPPWKLVLHVESGEEEAYQLDVDPRERESRPRDAPPALRQIAFQELESAERHELSAEEEAAVAKRLADLGYL